MVARLAVAAGTAPPSTVALISLLGAVGGWATVMILDGTAPMQPRPWAPIPRTAMVFARGALPSPARPRQSGV